MIEQPPASRSAASVSLSCTASDSGRDYSYTMPYSVANLDDDVTILSARVS